MGVPLGEEEVYIGEAQDCAHNAHERAAGDEAGSDERALLLPLGVNGSVLAAGTHVPGHGAADNQREVEVDGDEHAKSERQCRNAAEVEDDGDHCADSVEQPGCSAAAEHGLDDGRHGIGLRRYKGVFAGEAVGLVKDQHDAADGNCANCNAKEFPSFLLLGS